MRPNRLLSYFAVLSSHSSHRKVMEMVTSSLSKRLPQTISTVTTSILNRNPTLGNIPAWGYLTLSANGLHLMPLGGVTISYIKENDSHFIVLLRDVVATPRDFPWAGRLLDFTKPHAHTHYRQFYKYQLFFFFTEFYLSTQNMYFSLFLFSPCCSLCKC